MSSLGRICLVLAEFADLALDNPSITNFLALKQLLLHSSGVLWVTKGARSSHPLANIITGIARTLRSEHPDTLVVTLDMDAERELAPEAAAAIIYSLFDARFHNESDGKWEEADLEFREENGELLIPRLVEDSNFSEYISTGRGAVGAYQEVLLKQQGHQLRIELGTPGVLDTLGWVRMADLPYLADDCIEIDIKAAGVNFRDVMVSMNQIGHEDLGGECSGIVTAVGSSVKGFAVGDSVVCASLGCFATVVQVKAVAVQLIPPGISLETAAALPVAYVTAYYCIFHLAQVKAGETVLIHAAAGGVGQAAIEFCHLIGATVFATVGSEEKKNILMDRFGISEDRIFYSRDWSFAAGVLARTDNRGVDVVLNSVAGEALQRTWACMGPFGRFIELGKRDIFVNGRLEMQQFANNVTFATFDLVGFSQNKADLCGIVLGKVLDLVATARIRVPAPISLYPMGDVVKALQQLQSGRSIGKIVLVDTPNQVVQVLIRPLNHALLSPNASYLIIGGLGGVGRAIAEWMVHQGARHLILVSRSGLRHPEAQATVQSLESRGACVLVGTCDVTDKLQLRQLIARCTRDLRPIRGAIQGAMVLQDSLFQHMTLDEYQQAVRAKVIGTLNLHDELPAELDFFLLFSSISGIIGNVGQANYAGANTFLDAFATHRRRMGLVATSQDLGMITDIGHVAEHHDLAQAMAKQGFEGINKEQLLALVQYSILTSRVVPVSDRSPAQVVLGLGSWRETSPASLAQPMFAKFRHLTTQRKPSPGEEEVDVLAQVKLLPLEAANEAVCKEIHAKVSLLCQIPMDDILVSKALSHYGIDSMAAVEMRNWMFHRFRCTVSVLEIMASNSIAALSLKISQQIRL